MDVANQGGEREIQLVVAAVDEDALLIEHGAHGSIGHQNAVFQRLAEFG